MDGQYLPILIAIVAALFVYGIVCLVQGFTDNDKKKLHDRLGDERIDSGRSTRSSIVMQQMASSGLPASWAKNPFIQSLHSRIREPDHADRLLIILQQVRKPRFAVALAPGNTAGLIARFQPGALFVAQGGAIFQRKRLHQLNIGPVDGAVRTLQLRLDALSARGIRLGIVALRIGHARR